MSDEQENTQLPHNFLINIRDTMEVRFWANKLGVSSKELKATVMKVGNSLLSVTAELHFPESKPSNCKGINPRISKAYRMRP